MHELPCPCMWVCGGGAFSVAQNRRAYTCLAYLLDSPFKKQHWQHWAHSVPFHSVRKLGKIKSHHRYWKANTTIFYHIHLGTEREFCQKNLVAVTVITGRKQRLHTSVNNTVSNNGQRHPSDCQWTLQRCCQGTIQAAQGIRVRDKRWLLCFKLVLSNFGYNSLWWKVYSLLLMIDWTMCICFLLTSTILFLSRSFMNPFSWMMVACNKISNTHSNVYVLEWLIHF